MISVVAQYDDKYIDELIDGDITEWFEELTDSLRQSGIKLVDKARAQTKSDGGFGNITWNLRASIGMCLVDQNGKIFETYFPPINKGAHGNQIGREMAENIAVYARGKNEIFMVFVAAENYAILVQAKGKDVIKHVIGDNMEKTVRTLLKS